MVPDAAPDLSQTAELIARSKAGEHAAFDDLMARYRPRLVSFLHARLPAGRRGVADTQDLVQDVMLRAWQALPRFEHRGIGSFWLFLRAAAKNRLVDEWRRAGNAADPRPNAALADGLLDPPDPGASPRRLAIGAEEHALFEAALEGVPERERRAITLRVELGLDYDAIAADVAYPSPDAARMAIKRALAKVAEAIARRGGVG